MRASRRLRTTAVASLLLPLAACSPQGDAPLEELPPAIAAQLQPLPGTEVLVGAARPSRPVGAGPVGPPPVERACETTQEFFSYVLFPITFCSPLASFGEVLSTYQEATTPPRPPTTGETADRTYQLTSFQGRRLSPRLICHQRSGPWGATITKKQLCNGGTSCTMALPCAGCPVFLWGGDTCESTGRPPEVTFIPELHPRPQTSEKCPGSLSTCGASPDPTGTPPIIQ
jgi:hypothetical protein